MTIWPLGLAVALSLGVSAACGGADEAEEQDGSDRVAATAAAAAPPMATPSPAPASPTPETTEGEPTPCVFPTNTRSFRLTVTFEETKPGPDYGSVLRTLDALRSGSFGLFDDFSGEMTIESAFVAPDRSSLVVSQHGQESLSCVVIKPRAWCKAAGSTDWTEDLASQDFPSWPQELCTLVEGFLPISSLEGEKETVNGIQTVHYRRREESLGEEWLAGLDVQVALTHEVWLAEDGNWPVRMVFNVDYEGELVDQYSLDMLWEITDFNDPSITVEPPTLR